MKKFKGTKGKWMIKPLMDGDSNIQIVFDDWYKNTPDISLTLKDDIREEQKDNAQLIAAAPDLLQALQELKSWVGKLDDWRGEDPPCELVETALQKALGL